MTRTWMDAPIVGTPWIGAASPRDLTDADFAAAAETLRCEVAAIRAVWEVEAAGLCFRPDTSLQRRFEPHLMPREQWLAFGFEPAPGQAPWRASLALPEADRERAFAAAVLRDPEAALRATSWGAPQILGRHFALLGYSSAVEMVTDFATGAPAHLRGFVAFVTSQRLDAALRARDWLAFATGYNGDGRPAYYAGLIEAAFRRHSGVASAVVLRLGSRGPAVAVLQRALRLPDDGIFGPGTHEAVLGFQAAHGLEPDGVVGRATWAALGIEPGGGFGVPAQPTARENTLERVGEVARIVAPVATVAPLVPVVQAAVPPLLWQVLWWLAGVLIVLAVAPWALRRLRGLWR